MDAPTFRARVYLPSLALLPFDLPPAEKIILAIAGQESAWTHRRQIGGPARSFWQFESGGGVAGVMAHRASAAHAKALCAALAVPFDRAVVYEAIAWNDVLALGFARLLLWTHPKPLPADRDAAWHYYLDLWRPGNPHPATWPDRWAGR